MPDLANIRLRPLRRSDVADCAALHRRAFPGFFLSELGPSFLRHFYLAFANEPDAIALIAEDFQGRVQGVVVGTTRPAGFFKRLLLRRWYAFAWSSLRLLLGQPQAASRLLRALTYRGEGYVGVTGALLSSICVDRAAPRGVGRRLLAGFTKEVQSAGLKSAYLTTDADFNDRVNDFYCRAGWRLRGAYSTPEGRRMNCYTWGADSRSQDGVPTE